MQKRLFINSYFLLGVSYYIHCLDIFMNILIHLCIQFQCIYLFIYLSVCLFIYLSIYLFIYLSTTVDEPSIYFEKASGGIC